ncbi:MAG: AarF/ABC1/UbiB kinase family protein [bacterium]
MGLSLPKLRSTVGDLRRLRTIVSVLWDEGYDFLVDELQLRYLIPYRVRLRARFRLGVGLAGERLLRRAPHDVPPEVRLRRAFERLGPTFMKLGQLLSVRPDVVPAEYVRELAKLQDRGPQLGLGVAEKVVERELGQPIENLFRSFDPDPLAAASLAQVHRAELRDGTPVAVKVRRPSVAGTVRGDIHILTHLAALLERHVPGSRRFRPVELVREFADWTLKEIDLEVEGANMDMFRESLQKMPEVVVPRVHWDYVSPSVLVSDLIEGLKVDDLPALDAAGVDRRRLAEIGLRVGLHQFLINGFFHADPHPGNLTALPERGRPGDDGYLPLRLGLYDFGLVGHISDRFRFELISCFVSFVERDEDSYVQHVMDLAEVEDGADVRSFESEVRTVLAGVLHKPAERKSMAAAFYRVVVAGAAHGVVFPTDLVLLAKSFMTVESIGLSLWPEIDLESEMRPFLAEVVKEELDPSRLVSDIKVSAFDSLYQLRQLPRETRTLLERLGRGEVGVKVNLQELRDLKEEFDRQNDVRVLSLLAVTLILASAIVLRLDSGVRTLGLPLGEFGLIVGGVTVGWLLRLIRRRP